MSGVYYPKKASVTDHPFIVLPDPNHAEYYSGSDFKWERYWAVVFHETAHYAADRMWGFSGHTEHFYSTFIGLWLWNDIPMEYLEEEITYHGLGLKRGKKLAAENIISWNQAAGANVQNIESGPQQRQAVQSSQKRKPQPR